MLLSIGRGTLHSQHSTLNSVQIKNDDSNIAHGNTASATPMTRAVPMAISMTMAMAVTLGKGLPVCPKHDVGALIS